MTRSAALGIAVVGVAAALLAGCGSTRAPEPHSPGLSTGAGVAAAPDSPVPDAVRTSTRATGVARDAPTAALAGLQVRRKTWGGMCATGPCGSSLVIFGTGSWVLLAGGAQTQGTLPQADLVALSQAVRATRLDSATGAADCAADHDGTSVAYTWTSGGVTRSASSCHHPIDRADPLAVELERLATTIAH